MNTEWTIYCNINFHFGTKLDWRHYGHGKNVIPAAVFYLFITNKRDEPFNRLTPKSVSIWKKKILYVRYFSTWICMKREKKILIPFFYYN